MSPRRYHLGRRAKTAEATRQRLVEATFALHAEQGIRATSMKQIAERAGVSVGTAYHHFPTYDDAIVACDRHASATYPLPTTAMFDGVTSPAARVRQLTAEYCRYFERITWFEHLRAEPQRPPPVARFVEHEEAHRVALMREALKGVKLDPQQLRSAAVLMDIAVYAALRRAGLSTAAAADEIAAFVIARCVPPARPRR